MGGAPSGLLGPPLNPHMRTGMTLRIGSPKDWGMMMMRRRRRRRKRK